MRNNLIVIIFLQANLHMELRNKCASSERGLSCGEAGGERGGEGALTGIVSLSLLMTWLGVKLNYAPISCLQFLNAFDDIFIRATGSNGPMSPLPPL